MNNLVLNDLISIDELSIKHNNKRIMARFNTDWKDTDNKLHSYLDMYLNNPELFKNTANTIYSGKRMTRESERDVVLQFVKIEDPDLWLLAQAVDVQKKEGHTFTDPIFNYGNIWSANYNNVRELQKFVNVLVVKWKNGPQQTRYVNPEKVKNIPIYEILPKSYRERTLDFPGFNEISINYTDLKNTIDLPEWKQPLSNIYGVYLITDTQTGSLYVGSAYGENGVYGRWSTYLQSGYDKDENESGIYPNKRFQKVVTENGLDYVKDNFQYSLLEIFPKTEIGKSNALNRENYWKRVFDSRVHGYNAN